MTSIAIRNVLIVLFCQFDFFHNRKMTSDIYIQNNNIVQFLLGHSDTFSTTQTFNCNSYSTEFPDGSLCHQFSNLIHADMFQKQYDLSCKTSSLR